MRCATSWPGCARTALDDYGLPRFRLLAAGFPGGPEFTSHSKQTNPHRICKTVDLAMFRIAQGAQQYRQAFDRQSRGDGDPAVNGHATCRFATTA
jgi:hypothetical protein